MKSSDEMHNKIVMMKQSFFDEGFLIPTQFQELELLQDRDNMNFVRDRYSLRIEIEQILREEIYGKPRKDMNSIGALKILNGVNKIIQLSQKGNVEGIMHAFEQVRMETVNLRAKLSLTFR
ncbi:histidine-containing phosphotransfer protein 5 [Glycine soja]